MARFLSFLSALTRVSGGLAVSLPLLMSLMPRASYAAPEAAPPPTIWSAIAAAGGAELEREELRAIYRAVDGSLQWTSPARRADLMKILVGLEADGIDVKGLGAPPGDGALSPLEDDVAATRAVLRAAHVMAGTTQDADIIPGWHIAPPAADVVSALVESARGGKWEAAIARFRPATPAYLHLRTAHIHYRRLALEPWRAVTLDGPRIVERDDPRMTGITERLILLGDLEKEYGGADALDAAVMRFQKRHGLEEDGRIGPATLAELNVSPASRARQIAANLAYWRLLPRSWPQRYVAVNAAAAELELLQDGQSQLSSRVIVGDVRHPTPVMSASITAVTFNPPWNVPISIATKEILPRLKRDPGYLERSNIEIVGRTQDPHGHDVDWQQYARGHFPFQLRQVPGPGNSLGLVKFEMANQFDVYLHDTPNRSLFDKNARALSHGCVRVQCAQELADRLLDDPSVWLTSDASASLRDGRTLSVRLKQPLPVYLLYFTAFADADGTTHFRPDVYGRDAVLAAGR